MVILAELQIMTSISTRTLSGYFIALSAHREYELNRNEGHDDGGGGGDGNSSCKARDTVNT